MMRRWRGGPSCGDSRSDQTRAGRPLKWSIARQRAASTCSGTWAAISWRPCPTPTRSREALKRPRLRVHQDIVLSSSMLAECDGDVLLLPAATRYESPGGGTETSTERRIIFSPEIAGRRIGSAKPEWWVFRRSDGEHRAGARGISSACPMRRRSVRRLPGPCRCIGGIETLAAKGDQVQWGGRDSLCGWAVCDPRRQGAFRRRVARPACAGTERTPGYSFAVSTRRGKQFNSMVQREVDPLTGADRDAILISEEDLAASRSAGWDDRVLAVGVRDIQRPTSEGADQARQPRGPLAGRQQSAVVEQRRSRFSGTGLQRRRHDRDFLIRRRFFSTTTKSPTSQVNGGFWRRSVFRRSGLLSSDEVRLSPCRRSHDTLTGRSTAFSFSF